MPVPQPNERYTYADYRTWDEGERWELIDGIAYAQAAPSQAHQTISLNLTLALGGFLKGKPCKLFVAPSSVRLSLMAKDDTVVEPDLFVVCDKSKLDGQTCNGAPDLVIEVLSSSSRRMDRILKFQKYWQAGVREYWIVDPDDKTVHVCVLKDGVYNTYMYADSALPVSVLPGCDIDLKDVFEE